VRQTPKTVRSSRRRAALFLNSFQCAPMPWVSGRLSPPVFGRNNQHSCAPKPSWTNLSAALQGSVGASDAGAGAVSGCVSNSGDLANASDHDSEVCAGAGGREPAGVPGDGCTSTGAVVGEDSMGVGFADDGSTGWTGSTTGVGCGTFFSVFGKAAAFVSAKPV
jgi:hypothetical protein